MKKTLVLTLAAAAAAAHAGTLLGLDNNGIYRIDTVSGVSTLAASLSGHGTGDANALAYDAATNAAYFQRNGDLWRVDLGSGAFAQTGYGVGSIDDATFANGSYLYATSSSLMKVDFSGAAPTTVATYNLGWGFGDIATSGTTLYGSSGSSLFRIDLSNNGYTQLSNSGKQLQLGFVGSTLYGVANGNAGTPSGSIYTVDTATGALTSTGVVATYNGTALAIRDAATYLPGNSGAQPVPEPTSLAALAVGALGLLRRRSKA